MKSYSGTTCGIIYATTRPYSKLWLVNVH